MMACTKVKGSLVDGVDQTVKQDNDRFQAGQKIQTMRISFFAVMRKVAPLDTSNPIKHQAEYQVDTYPFVS